MSLSVPKSRIRSGMQLKTLTNLSDFEILPTEVLFPDIQPQVLYQMVVYVRNLAKVPRRVRILQPKSSKFRCDYDMQGVIAAGLSLRLIVMFETDAPGEFHDSVVLTSEDNFRFELLLHAMPSKPKIRFPKIVNLGFCKLNVAKEG